MTTKDSLPENESESVQETTQADKQGGEEQAEIASPLSIAQPANSEAQDPYPAESDEETDRKQDEAIHSLAEQTDWIEKQTKWVMYQTIATSVLGAVTLGVLLYHGFIMGRQSQAMKDQTEIMKGQLESMNSSSGQTNDLIAATQKTADASQSVAEQNKELIGQTGEQTKAMQTQADASLAQAEVAKQSLGIAKSSARAAEQSANVARQSFDIGERPYIIIKSARITTNLVPNRQIGATVKIANAGRTPAQHITATLSITYAPGQSFFFGFPDDKRWTLTLNEYFLAAGEEKAFGVAPVNEISLNSKAVDEINSGRELLYVHGEGSYRDMANRTYPIDYCFYYSPSAQNFVQCFPSLYGADKKKNKK